MRRNRHATRPTRSRPTTLLALLALLALAAACELPPGETGGTDAGQGADVSLPDPPAPVPDGPGQIWVANRGAASVSVIDAATDRVIDTLDLPDAGEPMYVNYSARQHVVFVGDRANDRLVVFDADTRALLRTIPTGRGVFHQWALPDGDQLWVNNDVDRTTTVVDTATWLPVATIPMPADLAAMEGAGAGLPKPHDVLVAPDGSAAYVSYLGFAGLNDYVVRFDTATFEETHRVAVGKDPHLTASATNDALYVPCQETNEVFVLARADLAERRRLSLPGAHGAGMAHAGDRLYVTNLPEDGAEALFVIDTATDTLLSEEGVDAPMNGKPHNVALSGGDGKVYVTHSGPSADIVSIYDVSETPVPVGAFMQVRVGTNPFGIGFVPVASVLPARPYTKVALDVSDLGTLRDGHHYEGWAIFDGEPVSTGKFNVDASGAATDLAGIAIPDGVFDAGRDLRLADALVVTIEEPGDVDIVPNDTHYLAGDVEGIGATLRVSHPDAIGTDFSDAMGMFILATPTDGPDSDEVSGVWFVNLQMVDPKPGLVLPALPPGWTYEGWAVIDGVPVSTGRFLDPDAADDAAPFGGDLAGPPFPGEDFLVDAPAGVTFPTDLSEAPIVVSVEPVPDDSPAPFALKPLTGAAPAMAAAGQTFYMDPPAPTLPVVTAILKE